MEITEVRIKLIRLSDDRLQAFCSITIDNAFVVRDLKIIEGPNGPFVAMPSRKISGHCPFCHGKNPLRAVYCNQCGKRQPAVTLPKEAEGRVKLYADIAHPINSECRELIQRKVVDAFEAELEKARQPGYVSRYEEDFDEPDDDYQASPTQRRARTDPAHGRKDASRPDPKQSANNPLQRGNDDFGAGVF